MSQATFKFVAGRLVCGHFRELLEQAKFMDYDISYHESSGLLEREFIVKGHPQHVAIIKQKVNEICDRLK